MTVLAGATAKILPHACGKDVDFFRSPVGTGAFRFARASDTEILLTRNDHYWREPARLEVLRFLVADESQGILLAARGEVQDLVTYPFNGDESIFKQGGQHLQIPVVATWILGINTRLKPFDRKAVRTQFKAAFSPDEFVEKFYPGQTPARGGYIPPGLPGYLASADVSRSGLDARKLVVREPLRLVIPELLAKAPAMKLYFEEKLRKAGFQAVTVELASWENQEARYNAKTMQSFLMSQNADYPDPEFLVRNFASNNPDNFSGLHSEKVDRMIEQARETDSRSERAQLYEKLAHVLNAEAVTVNLLHFRAHYWFASCVRGMELNSLGDVYLPYRKLSLEGDCAPRGPEVADAR